MFRLIAGVLLLPMAALAEPALPKALSDVMAEDPERFMASLTDLVAGFGGAEGLTAAGVEEFIALERAAARATALRRMLAMDLDNDGRVARAELRVSQRAASARQRGILERGFLAADRDGDGMLAAPELRADAEAAALRNLGEGEASVLRSLLLLDRDGDARLTMEEARIALAPAGDAT